MKIAPRIYLIVAIMLLASVVTFGIAQGGMSDIRATYNTAFKERAPVTRIIDDFRATSLDLKLQVWTLLVADMPKDFTQQQIDDMAQLKGHISELIADWDKNAVKGASPAEEAKFKELVAATDPWFKAIDEYNAHMQAWVDSGSATERKAAFDSNDSGAVDSTQSNIEDITAALVKINEAESRKVQGEAEREQDAALLRLALVVGGTSLASLILAVVIAVSITRPVRRTVQFAQSVAHGDLAAKIGFVAGGEMGELADAIESMKESLVDRVNTMREVAAMVEIAAEGVADTAGAVSASAAKIGDQELVQDAERLLTQSANLRSALSGFDGATPTEASAEAA